eukprot:5593058-Pleurochrysis_carterae.AAC.1
MGAETEDTPRAIMAYGSLETAPLSLIAIGRSMIAATVPHKGTAGLATAAYLRPPLIVGAGLCTH